MEDPSWWAAFLFVFIKQLYEESNHVGNEGTGGILVASHLIHFAFCKERRLKLHCEAYMMESDLSLCTPLTWLQAPLSHPSCIWSQINCLKTRLDSTLAGSHIFSGFLNGYAVLFPAQYQFSFLQLQPLSWPRWLGCGFYPGFQGGPDSALPTHASTPEMDTWSRETH